MKKLATIILLIILSFCASAQEAPRERVLVTKPGASAAFRRHPAQQAPGRSFTFRYRFEGSDGAIRRICRQIAAESDEAPDSIESGDDDLPDAGEVMRLNEALMAEALASLANASETATTTATASEAVSAGRQ